MTAMETVAGDEWLQHAAARPTLPVNRDRTEGRIISARLETQLLRYPTPAANVRSRPQFMQNGFGAPGRRRCTSGAHSSQATMTRDSLASSAASSVRSTETSTRQTFGSRSSSL